MSAMTEEAASREAAIQAARAKLRAQVGPVQRRGGMRVAARPAAPQAREGDKVKNALKKLNLQSIGAIDEVVLKRSDTNTALFFKSPKVSLSPHSNTTVITGNFTEEEVPLDDLFTSRMLRQIANPTGGKEDDIPTLVEDFEAVASQQPPQDDIPELIEEENKIEEVD
eukprot:Protomagalhaensia_wolfi_Nauph_80__3371@NODE_3427_length_803_cov_310_065445_g2690_i0_p1_GENE_NODE_3427_length_803_cov_310_065445_g2690_i0NODE_3427_length_803_cov_310_065445_g2690_i0_p1_ORF_typecomplete_len168_score41_15NAC/PF01849_18/1_6e14SRP_SPB/PF02978_19/0_23_NODE_3427_length_803_cov_310_065445_g2690_i0214717